jgi:hypothetical protein
MPLKVQALGYLRQRCTLSPPRRHARQHVGIRFPGRCMNDLPCGLGATLTGRIIQVSALRQGSA